MAEGEAFFGPDIAARLLHLFQDKDKHPKSKTASIPFPELTEREREVLTCIARGDTNAQIYVALLQAINVRTQIRAYCYWS